MFTSVNYKPWTDKKRTSQWATSHVYIFKAGFCFCCCYCFKVLNWLKCQDFMRLYIYVCAYIYVYMYIYTCICIHTYTHTHRGIQNSRNLIKYGHGNKLHEAYSYLITYQFLGREGLNLETQLNIFVIRLLASILASLSKNIMKRNNFYYLSVTSSTSRNY